MAYKIYQIGEIPTDIEKQLPESSLEYRKTVEIVTTYEEGRKVLSALIAYRNDMHPDALYLKYEMIQDDMDKKIYTDLFIKLRQNKSQKNFIISTENMTKTLLAFLADQGFFEMQRTYEKYFHIDTLISLSPMTYNVQSSHSFSVNQDDVSELVHVYEYTHRLNPPKQLSEPQWLNLITEDLDEDFSVLIRNNGGNVTGYILVYNGDAFDDKEIGWCYFKDEKTRKSLVNIFSRKLEEMKRNGVLNILIEADTSNRYTYGLFERALRRQLADTYTFICLSDSNIEIRDIEYEDYVAVNAWQKDKEFCESNHWDMDNDIETMKNWWMNILKQQSPEFKRYKICVNHKMVGYIDQYTSDHSIEMGLAIGDKDTRNNGIGTMCLSQLTMEASLQHHSKRIIAITDQKNMASQRMLTKAGYKFEKNIDKDDCLYVFERYKDGNQLST
jgi:RimJ/RimL family protein N-acetyltransferase